jgi:hypothetical protein
LLSKCNCCSCFSSEDKQNNEDCSWKICVFQTDYLLRPLLLWGVTYRRLVVSYDYFGTACQSHLQGSSGPSGILGIGGFLLDCLTFEDGTDTLPQNVGNQLPMLHNIPEGERFQLRHGRSLISCRVHISSRVQYLLPVVYTWSVCGIYRTQTRKCSDSNYIGRSFFRA